VRVKPGSLKQLLSDWFKEVQPDLRNQLLAIDGKRLRGVSDNEHITHLVELFAVEGRLVIAQEQVPDKQCERKALHGLLNTVDVTGAIISMDAHYAYAEDLCMILRQGAEMIIVAVYDKRINDIDTTKTRVTARTGILLGGARYNRRGFS
jgi:hypothetical protein